MEKLKALKFDDSKAAYNLIAAIRLRQRRRIKRVVEDIELIMAPFVAGVQ